MADSIVNLKKVAENGLLSKIQIGGKTYEIKDLIAREHIDALEAAVKNIQENAYDDTQLKADLAAEAKARADADTAIGERIDGIDALLNTVDSEDAITSLKELALWVEEHGGEAAEMAKAIEALEKAVDAVEELLGEGGKVADQIAAAVTEAKGYTDDEIGKLGALAKKNSAEGKVAGQTISGVKASGQSAGSIKVELEQSSHAMNSTGKYTPAGNVTGTVTTAGSIAVTAKHEDTAATLTKADYTPEGDVSVAGKCKDYAVKTAEFNPAAIEVAVGDIVVSEKTVTVQ